MSNKQTRIRIDKNGELSSKSRSMEDSITVDIDLSKSRLFINICVEDPTKNVELAKLDNKHKWNSGESINNGDSNLIASVLKTCANLFDTSSTTKTAMPAALQKLFLTI